MCDIVRDVSLLYPEGMNWNAIDFNSNINPSLTTQPKQYGLRLVTLITVTPPLAVKFMMIGPAGWPVVVTRQWNHDFFKIIGRSRGLKTAILDGESPDTN